MAKYTQSEEELAREINEQFLFAKRYLDPVHQRMNYQEELYRSFINSSTNPNKANVFDPRTFRIIETVTPRMVANEPTGNFYPSEFGDVATSHILNALIKYDWRRAEMFPKLVMAAKSLLIFGTFFGRNYWDFRETERTRMIPKTINGRLVWTPKNTERIKITEFDGPNFEVLNIYDCYPDPNATNLTNMRWFVYRIFKTLEELKHENDTRGFEKWKNLDKLEEAMAKKKEENKSMGVQPQDLQYREHRRMMLSTQELLGQDESNPDFPILVRFTPNGWVWNVPDFNLIIREEENPYFHGELPITYGVDYPYPGELYGIGEIEPIDRIQRAINAVLNQRLDNVQLTLNTMWKVKKNSGVDINTLVSAPGNIVTTDNMDAVEPLVTPDVTGQTFVQTMTYLTSALQNGSGITDYTVGIGSNKTVGNDTATGTRLIQQEANAQFKLKIQLFNHMVIERIVNQWKDLRIQYTTEEQELRIIGKDQVKYLLENTQLATTSLEDGSEIVPGDFETPTKLHIAPDQSFAFLKLLPEDIQPSVAGNWDFIATVGSDQLNDPIAMQENYSMLVDRYSKPDWTQGLAQQNKMLNYEALTNKGFEKLGMGVEEKEILTELPQMNQMGGQDMSGQPLTPEQIMAMKAPMPDPLSMEPQGGMYEQPAGGIPQPTVA